MRVFRWVSARFSTDPSQGFELRLTLVRHFTLGASCGYTEGTANENAKFPPLQCHSFQGQLHLFHRLVFSLVLPGCFQLDRSHTDPARTCSILRRVGCGSGSSAACLYRLETRWKPSWASSTRRCLRRRPVVSLVHVSFDASTVGHLSAAIQPTFLQPEFAWRLLLHRLAVRSFGLWSLSIVSTVPVSLSVRFLRLHAPPCAAFPARSRPWDPRQPPSSLVSSIFLAMATHFDAEELDHRCDTSCRTPELTRVQFTRSREDMPPREFLLGWP